MKQKVIKPTKKQVTRWFKSYEREMQRQMNKPSMKAFKDDIYKFKNKNKFVGPFASYLQERYAAVADGKRKTLGNVMRDFVNDTKFDYSAKQAKALLKGIKNIDDTAGEFGLQLNDDILDLSKRLQKATKGKSYGEQVNLIRTDMYNIMNEDVGMISTVNDTLKQLGVGAQTELEMLMDQNPLLDENDPRVKRLKELAKFTNSYGRAEYIGNRIFGS